MTVRVAPNLLPLLLTLLATGCGGGDEATIATEVEPTAETPVASPLETIPPERLYGASPAENLWSPRIELEMPGLQAGTEGVKLAVLSDFQLGLWEGNDEVAAAAVRHAVAQNPDLIVLLGDYVARGDDVLTLQRVLQPLSGRRAVAVLGDHDIRSDSLEARIVRTLESAGVTVLRNSTVSVTTGGATLSLAGVDPAILASGWGTQEQVIANLAAPGSSTILLTHAPQLAARAPEGRFPLILAGNTFCGSVEVPGTPRLSWLREEALPGAAMEEFDRIFQLRGSTLVITCGIGYGFVPLRFGAAPEVPIVSLVGATEGQNDALAGDSVG